MTARVSLRPTHVSLGLFFTLLILGRCHGHLQEEWKKYVDSQLNYLRSEILQYVRDHSLILKTLSALNWHLLTLKMDIKQLEVGRKILKTRIDYSLTNVTHHIGSIEEKLKDLEIIISQHQQTTLSPNLNSLDGSDTVQKPAPTSTQKPTTPEPTTPEPTTPEPTTPEPTTPKPTTPDPTTTPTPEGPSKCVY